MNSCRRGDISRCLSVIRRDARDEANAPAKRGNMAGFYSNLLHKNVAFASNRWGLGYRAAWRFFNPFRRNKDENTEKTLSEDLYSLKCTLVYKTCLEMKGVCLRGIPCGSSQEQC